MLLDTTGVHTDWPVLEWGWVGVYPARHVQFLLLPCSVNLRSFVFAHWGVCEWNKIIIIIIKFLLFCKLIITKQNDIPTEILFVQYLLLPVSFLTSDGSNKRNRDTTACFSTTATVVIFFNNDAYFKKFSFKKKCILSVLKFEL